MNPAALLLALAPFWPFPAAATAPKPADPLAALAARFPPEDAAAAGWRAALAWRDLARRRAEDAKALGDWVGERNWSAAEADAEFRRKAWDALDNVRRLQGCESTEYRLSEYQRLAGLIGPADFAAGRMPAPSPWWLYPIAR